MGCTSMAERETADSDERVDEEEVETEEAGAEVADSLEGVDESEEEEVEVVEVGAEAEEEEEEGAWVVGVLLCDDGGIELVLGGR